jgi:hypothetical protein
MNTRTWLAGFFAIVGFGLAASVAGVLLHVGVIVTKERAGVMSELASKAAEASSLTPYCVAAAEADPKRYQVFLDLKEARVERRFAILAAAGWATPKGASAPNSGLIFSCLNGLGF